MSTLKGITLHRAEVDNSGAFREAGSEIPVGNAAAEIRAERARQILTDHGGVGHYAAAAPKASKPSAPKKSAKPAPVKVAAPAPAPAASTTPAVAVGAEPTKAGEA